MSTRSGRLHALRIAASAVLLLAAAQLVTAITALASNQGFIDAVSPNPTTTGAVITLTGHGWNAGAEVDIYWDDLSHQVAATAADGGGVIDVATTVPSAAAPGAHQVHACTPPGGGQAGCAAGEATPYTVNVTAPPTPPPTASPAPTPTPTAVVTAAPGHPPAPPSSPAPRSTPVALALQPPAAVPGHPSPIPSPSSSPTAEPSPVAVIAAPAASAPPPATARPLLAYSPTADPRGVVSLEIAAFVLLGLAGSRPLVLAGSRWWMGSTGAVDVPEQGAWGDMSATWHWQGTDWLDARSASLPVLLAPRSALLARVVGDGSYLRAMFGALSLALPLAGLCLGVAAVLQTNGQAMPPSLELLIALTVIGVLDATAGMIGVAAFIAGIAISGGLWSPEAARTLLGLCAIWFATPLIAGAARPLRRPVAVTLAARVDRLGDFAVAGLLGAWAVQKLVGALPGLSGVAYPVAASADVVALAVLAALLARLLGESLAARFYPERLITVQPPALPSPGRRHRQVMSLLRTGLFVFIAAPFVGIGWQLATGGVLFLAAQLLGAGESRIPGLSRLGRLVPRGIARTVVMLVAGAGFGALVLGNLQDPQSVIADAFVLLSMLGLALAVVGSATTDGPGEAPTWWQRGAGVLLLGVGVLVALGFVL